MKKIFIALTLVLLLALVVATTVTAKGRSLYGGPIANTPIRGKAFSLPTMKTGTSTHVYMDLWGACSDLQATRTNNIISLAGVTYVNGNWPTYGAALVSGATVLNMYLVVSNPYADSCASGWIDEADFFGSSLAKRVVGGTGYSYCGGVVDSSSAWNSAVYSGYCP